MSPTSVPTDTGAAPAVERWFNRAFDYRFRRADLLATALTHRSVSASNNERLEFLGDALLGFVIGEALYQRFPAADEGQLTRLRSSLVNKDTLAGIGRALDLGSAVRLGEGELKSGGWRRASIIANALEALIGAIYLDGGMQACRDTVLRLFADHLEAASPERIMKDPKTRLQEYLQARRRQVPTYETIAVTGEPHRQTFTVRCEVEGLEETVSAEGESRRRAEQAAALKVLELLGGRED